MSEQGGRYNRSFEGMVGAMIVLVIAVVGFVVYRGFFSDPEPRTIDDVDYLSDVRDLQTGGYDATYPAALPQGWKATEVRIDDPGDRPQLAINFFTADDHFVGLRQADAAVDDMLAAAGVDDAAESDPLTGIGGLADTWQGWSDPDGDHAFTAEVGGQTVVVYGSVSARELAGLVEQLTQDPVPATASSSSSPVSPVDPSAS